MTEAINVVVRILKTTRATPADEEATTTIGVGVANKAFPLAALITSSSAAAATVEVVARAEIAVAAVVFRANLL